MHSRKVWSLHMMAFGVVWSKHAWNDECAGCSDRAYMYCMLTINISYVELLLTDSSSSKVNMFPTQKRTIWNSLWQYYCPQVKSLSRQWEEQIKSACFTNPYRSNKCAIRILCYYYYRYSALGPVWAETRAQSVDWYSSGTLHPGQVEYYVFTPN